MAAFPEQTITVKVDVEPNVETKELLRQLVVTTLRQAAQEGILEQEIREIVRDELAQEVKRLQYGPARMAH